MSKSDGYGFWWRNQYCLSLTTGGRPDGTHVVMLHSVGADTHQYLWVHVEGSHVVGGGTRLKDRGAHVTDPSTFIDLSTGPFVRAALEWQDETVAVSCQLAQPVQNSAVTAAPSMSKPQSNRQPQRFDLGSDDAPAIDCSFRLVPKTGVSTASLADSEQYLPFGGDSPFGLIVRSSARSD